MNNKNAKTEPHRDLIKQLYENRFISPQIPDSPFKKAARIQKIMKSQRSPKHFQQIKTKASKSFSYIGPIFIDENQNSKYSEHKPLLIYTQQSVKNIDEPFVLREKPQTANIRINNKKAFQKTNFLRAQKFTFNADKGQRIFHIMKMVKQGMAQKKQVLSTGRTLPSRKVMIGGLDLEKQAKMHEKINQTLDCHLNILKQIGKQKKQRQNQQNENLNRILGMDIRRKIKSQKQTRSRRINSIDISKQYSKRKTIISIKNIVNHYTIEDQIDLNPWVVDTQF